MKIIPAILLTALAAFIGAGFYDASGHSRCEISYDTSFNGLWLIKEHKCWGRLGLYSGATELARKPLFEAF